MATIEPPTAEELTALHVYIENALVEFRDERISMLNRANGLVIRERNGEPSSVIRIGTRDACAVIVRRFLELRGLD